MPLIDVPLVPGVIDAVKARVAEFWAMVDEGREPKPDFARDGAVIDRIYAGGDEHHEVDLTRDNRVPELLAARAELLKSRSATNAAIDEIDAEIKAKLGNAHVAHIAGGRKITWRPQRRAGGFVAPSVSRVLRYPNPRED
jgi:predicted phage-related endonuclease